MESAKVYRLCVESEWKKAGANYEGSEFDHKSGFIHLSTRSQIAATAKRFFSNEKHLLLIEFVVKELKGGELKWDEVIEDDSTKVFPHWYGPHLPTQGPAVSNVWKLPLSVDGEHILPF